MIRQRASLETNTVIDITGTQAIYGVRPSGVPGNGQKRNDQRDILGLMLLTKSSPMWQVALSQAALGMRAAFFVAPNMSATLGDVPQEQLEIAFGLLDRLRSMGGGCAISSDPV